jgi:hypothetical protein
VPASPAEDGRPLPEYITALRLLDGCCSKLRVSSLVLRPRVPLRDPRDGDCDCDDWPAALSAALKSGADRLTSELLRWSRLLSCCSCRRAPLTPFRVHGFSGRRPLRIPPPPPPPPPPLVRAAADLGRGSRRSLAFEPPLVKTTWRLESPPYRTRDRWPSRRRKLMAEAMEVGRGWARFWTSGVRFQQKRRFAKRLKTYII